MWPIPFSICNTCTTSHIYSHIYFVLQKLSSSQKVKDERHLEGQEKPSIFFAWATNLHQEQLVACSTNGFRQVQVSWHPPIMPAGHTSLWLVPACKHLLFFLSFSLHLGYSLVVKTGMWGCFCLASLCTCVLMSCIFYF